ncbi:hypothetical protein LOC68_23185 [Blastopirellula sp. JC732]|uniref:Secreted protein n=1 Tax=Blastopirellula sediminis TaxID=2894196 RepID=A0A9X1MPZ3_9BACT|nr:hypothetical protein [Blastopirellula sediminis]MCC9605392.1 hypothetical protein [Blastopirellula sediminis]MCC9631308.1 hypothetical protein [Blastopirellula sediminis]
MLRTSLAILLVCSLAVANVDAAVVLLRGDADPVAGYVESRSGGVLRLRIPQGGGQSLTREIPLIEVEEVLETVSPLRLTELRPEDPDSYRNYAEELAQKKVDPEARETALRLFLIAARLDPTRLGKSSLLGMTSIARSPEEANRFQAMAYLLDPEHDAQLIQKRHTVQLTSPERLDEWSDLIITGMRKLRGGDYRSARAILKRPDVEKAFDSIVGEITHDECMAILNKTCPGCEGGRIPKAMIRKLVLAELALLPETHDSSDTESVPEWSELTAAENHKPLVALTLETITEFDPRTSVYRNKQWVSP